MLPLVDLAAPTAREASTVALVGEALCALRGRSGVAPQRFEQRALELKLYPLDAELAKFRAAVPKTKNSGMVRPAAKDKVPLQITFDAILSFSAAAPTPLAAYFLAPLDERCGWPPVPTEMDPTYMLKAPSRIARAIAAPFALVAAARLAASWRRPATTALALLWWSVLCLYATWWQLPMLVALALAAAIAATRPVSAGADGRFANVELWGDSVEAAQVSVFTVTFCANSANDLTCPPSYIII